MASTENLMDLTNQSVFSSDMDYTTNETIWDDKIDISIPYAVAFPIVCILTVVGNLGTIYAFWKVPELWGKPSEMLILNLSFADLVIGTLYAPLYAPTYITPGHWPSGEITCRIAVFGAVFGSVAGNFTLAAISLDRFLLVLKDYPQYMKIQTKRRILMSIGIIWSIAAVLRTTEIAFWDVAKTLDKNAAIIDYNEFCLSPPRRVNLYAMTVAITGVYLPAILVCVLSTSFFHMLRRRLKISWSMRAESQMSTTVGPQKSTQEAMARQQRKQYIKPAVVLSVLVSAMLLCMLPYYSYVIVESFCLQCINKDLHYFFLFIVQLNTCLDPILYAMTQRKIQKFYKDCLKKCCIKKKM